MRDQSTAPRVIDHDSVGDGNPASAERSGIGLDLQPSRGLWIREIERPYVEELSAVIPWNSIAPGHHDSCVRRIECQLRRAAELGRRARDVQKAPSRDG